jgi:hypothetical protein
MSVALSSDVAVTSFYACIADKIEEENKGFNDIFNICFKPERVLEYVRVLKQYDDVMRCFNRDSLIDSFTKKWNTIFNYDNEGYVCLKERYIPELEEDDKNFSRRIVVYLVKRMQPQLNNYPSKFLRDARIYKKSPN